MTGAEDQFDNIYVNRNCGYCGQTFLKVNQKFLLNHVHQCEAIRIEKDKYEKQHRNPNPPKS